MKKILVASPIRGGMNQFYVRFILMLHFCGFNKIMGGPKAPWNIFWATTSGTSVNLARDELADLALRETKEPFDGVVWLDIDLGPTDARMMLDMFCRIMSHTDKVEVVAGQYVGHQFSSSFHGATSVDGAIPDENGLLEMAQIPLGFSWTSTKALKQIKAFHPQREYVIKETEKQVAKGKMFEMFPIGVCGPCSDSGKMERVKAAMKGENMSDEYKEIERIINDTAYESNFLLGEDYYFCKLAREAGVKMYIDNNLLIPHETNLRLPVNNQSLLAALSEEWRLHNDAKPEQVAELLKQLAPLLSMDIPG